MWIVLEGTHISWNNTNKYNHMWIHFIASLFRSDFFLSLWLTRSRKRIYGGRSVENPLQVHLPECVFQQTNSNDNINTNILNAMDGMEMFGFTYVLFHKVFHHGEFCERNIN